MEIHIKFQHDAYIKKEPNFPLDHLFTVIPIDHRVDGKWSVTADEI